VCVRTKVHDTLVPVGSNYDASAKDSITRKHKCFELSRRSQGYGGESCLSEFPELHPLSHLRVRVGNVEIEASAINNEMLANILNVLAKPILDDLGKAPT